MKSTVILGLAAASLLAASGGADAQYYGRRGYEGSYYEPYVGSYSRGYYSGSRYSSGYGGDYYRQSFSGPVYHDPSVHYDRVYHPTDVHWTPRRGWHTHGHYDLVPHYTPGHFDHQHGSHLHLNPRYHHHRH